MIGGYTLIDYTNSPFFDDNDTIGFRIPIGLPLPFPFSPSGPILVKLIDINDKVVSYVSDEQCTLTDSIRAQIRDNINKNINDETLNKIEITFFHKPNCNKQSGINIVSKYRDEVKKEIFDEIDKEFVDAHKKLEIANAETPSNAEKIKKAKQEFQSAAAKKIKMNKFKDRSSSLSNKYNKSDDQITKIKLFLNNEEYKEIPYSGQISNEYYKKLFTHSFDLFPIKKIKN